LIKHRNCFYPCPLIIDSSDIEDIQPGDDFVALFDLLLDQEIRTLQSGISISDFTNLQHASRLSTPLRFDFDSEAQTTTHPASHLHIIDEDCRWPVFGPIGVGHFIRFIFHHFYPKLCSDFSILKNWKLEFLPRSITQQEQAELFIECQGSP
jgi:hypothetical protein